MLSELQLRCFSRRPQKYVRRAASFLGYGLTTCMELSPPSLSRKREDSGSITPEVSAAAGVNEYRCVSAVNCIW